MFLQLIDTRAMMILFLLAVLAFGAMLLASGDVWDLIGAENNYPVNDCGKNYFFVFEWTDPNGCVQRHTKAGVDKPTVDTTRANLDPNQIGGTLDSALRYIEQWMLK